MIRVRVRVRVREVRVEGLGNVREVRVEGLGVRVGREGCSGLGRKDSVGDRWR